MDPSLFLVLDRQKDIILVLTEGGVRTIVVGGALSLADFSYVAGLGALGTVGDLKFNRVTLFKGFEPFPLDGGVVDKYILATINFDKSKTLSVIEPLHSSCH